MKKRIAAFLALLLGCAAMLTIMYMEHSDETDGTPDRLFAQGENGEVAEVAEEEPEDRGALDLELSQDKTTVRLWYADDALTDYLVSEAVAFNEAHSDMRIEPELHTEMDYLDAINEASLSGETYPDLYIATNDVLEKAYLAYLAVPVGEDGRFLTKEMYPEAALNAVTYDGKYVGYPFYYETSTLLYNRTYLEAYARDRLETDKLEANPDADIEDPVLQVSEEEIDRYVEEMLPQTIPEMLLFARDYNAPEGVDGVFAWDVTDIFYNYCFVGAYMNAGGEAGDNVTKLELYNEDTVRCMKMYQELKEFFAIDADESSYEKVLRDFINGRIVYTIATSDAVPAIREAVENGECEYEFGASVIPDLTGEYKTRTMSVTDALVVNGYTEHYEEAQTVARYLVRRSGESLFDRTGKLPARVNVQYEDQMLTQFAYDYADSVPMPKMMETSNLWMRLEIAFTRVWNGADPNTAMKELSEIMMKQIVGNDYVEMVLPDPETASLTVGMEDE